MNYSGDKICLQTSTHFPLYLALLQTAEKTTHKRWCYSQSKLSVLSNQKSGLCGHSVGMATVWNQRDNRQNLWGVCLIFGFMIYFPCQKHNSRKSPKIFRISPPEPPKAWSLLAGPLHRSDPAGLWYAIMADFSVKFLGIYMDVWRLQISPFLFEKKHIKTPWYIILWHHKCIFGSQFALTFGAGDPQNHPTNPQGGSVRAFLGVFQTIRTLHQQNTTFCSAGLRHGHQRLRAVVGCWVKNGWQILAMPVENQSDVKITPPSRFRYSLILKGNQVLQIGHFEPDRAWGPFLFDWAPKPFSSFWHPPWKSWDFQLKESWMNHQGEVWKKELDIIG